MRRRLDEYNALPAGTRVIVTHDANGLPLANPDGTLTLRGIAMQGCWGAYGTGGVLPRGWGRGLHAAVRFDGQSGTTSCCSVWLSVANDADPACIRLCRGAMDL